ncbi:MAG: hypothetical protein U0401_17700 [Anaerolineae bacterium]
MIAAQVVIGLIVPFAATLYLLRTGTGITVRVAISDYGRSQEAFKPGQIDRLLERLRHLPRTFLLSWRNLFRRKGAGPDPDDPQPERRTFCHRGQRAGSLLNTDEFYTYRKYDLRLTSTGPTARRKSSARR